MQNNGSMKKIVLLFGVLILAFALYSVVTSREAFWGNNYSSEQNSGVESNNTNAPNNNDNKAPAVDSEKNSVAESNKTNTSNSSNKKPSSAENKDNNSMDILVPDHDHIYELKVLVPSSCGVEGIQAYVCVICEKQQYVTSIAALPHDYQYSATLSTNLTCTTDGKKVYRCNKCGYTQAEVLAAKGHSWSVKTTCDSNTNELIISPYCTSCQVVSAYGYRYKINDVKKLVSINGQFSESGGYSSSGGVIIEQYPAAPYYAVFCTDTYLLIVRNTEPIARCPDYGVIGGPVSFYTSRGCTVVLEATISITADGRIQVLQ